MMWKRKSLSFVIESRLVTFLRSAVICFRGLGETNCKVYCLFHSSCSKTKEKRSGSCVKVELPWLLRSHLVRLSWLGPDVFEDVKGNIISLYVRYPVDKNNRLSMCPNVTRVTEVVIFLDVTSRSHKSVNVSGGNFAFIVRTPEFGGNQFPLKSSYACTWLHGVTSQKTVFRILVNSGSIRFHNCYSFTQNCPTNSHWYKASPL